MPSQVTQTYPRITPSSLLDVAFQNTINSLYTGTYQASNPVVDSSGNVYVIRMSTSTAQAAVYKFSSAGTQDATYLSNQGTAIGYTLNAALCMTSSGKVMATNYSGQSVNGSAVYGIYRLNTNGTKDSGFTLTGTGLTANSQPFVLAEVESSKILAGGQGWNTFNGSTIVNNIS